MWYLCEFLFNKKTFFIRKMQKYLKGSSSSGKMYSWVSWVDKVEQNYEYFLKMNCSEWETFEKWQFTKEMNPFSFTQWIYRYVELYELCKERFWVSYKKNYMYS